MTNTHDPDTYIQFIYILITHKKKLNYYYNTKEKHK